MDTVVMTATAFALVLAAAANVLAAMDVATTRQRIANGLNAIAFLAFAIANGWPAISAAVG